MKTLILIFVGSGLIATTYLLSARNTPKIGYVELENIYNNFSMKKELESKLTNVQQLRSNIIDSLKIQLNALGTSITSDKQKEAIHQFEIKKQELMTKQENFERDNNAASQTYSSQIWKQINQYVKDYGKQKGYTLLMGADGSGNLMYADEAKNVTKEVSDYINSKYNGLEK